MKYYIYYYEKYNINTPNTDINTTFFFRINIKMAF